MHCSGYMCAHVISFDALICLGVCVCVCVWCVSVQAVSLDPAEKKVTLDDGVSITYGKLLLATGGSPKNLPIFTAAPAEAQAMTTVFRNVIIV